MRNSTRLLRAAAALASILASATAWAVDFGEVELVEGQVTVQSQDGLVRNPKVGETIEAGAEIATGKNGEIHIATTDSGYVALRPNTRLRVAEYRAEGDDQDVQVLALLRGTFRSITGWIGRSNPDRYKITTPAATIGVRGTDHEPSYWEVEDLADAGDDEARQAGTYDKVNEGATFIENEGGRLELGKGEFAFARKGHKPGRLITLPRFFRGTAHEARIVERREALRKVRELRRKEMHERMKRRIERRKELREKIRDRRERNSD